MTLSLFIPMITALYCVKMMNVSMPKDQQPYTVMYSLLKNIGSWLYVSCILMHHRLPTLKLFQS